MESKPKYIEDNHYYEVDDWFVDKLKSYPRKIGIEIAAMVDYNFDTLPNRRGWTQRVGGVCTKFREPIFFEVEYLKEPNEPPIFLDIEPIDVDEYLDYILDKNVLKLKSNVQNTTNRTKSGSNTN